MNVISVHIFYPPRASAASAHIDVPGIGEIHIDNAISNELREAIAKEAIIALRRKMGLPLFAQQVEEIKETSLECKVGEELTKAFKDKQ